MFSRMAKYSSLTAFYTFSEQQPKATEDKVCKFASVLKFMYRVVKSSKICSVPRIFKTKCKLFSVRKENTKQKEIIHLVDPRTLQNKAAETIF